MNTPATAESSPSLRVQAFWLMLSKVIVAVINIALPILLVRFMDQKDYGLFKQTFMFSATAASFASLGVGVSAFYFIPRYPERAGQISFNIILYNLFSGMALFLLLAAFPELLQKLFRTNALQDSIVLVGIIPMLTLTSSLIQHVPTAMKDVRNSTVFIIGTQLVKAGLLAGTVIVFRGVKPLIVAYIVGHIFTNAVVFFYLYKRFGAFWRTFEWPFFKQQLLYAFPLGALGLLYVVKNEMHSYFVSAAFGPTQFAIYSVGCMQVPFVSLLLESVAIVLVVRVSALQQEGRTDEIRRVLAAAMNRVAAVQFPFCVFLFVAGRDLIVLLYTRTYEPAFSVFAINILLLPLSVLMVDPIIRAFTELRKYVLAVRLTLMLLLAGSLAFLIRTFGMIGAVSAAVAVDLLERLFYGWRAAKVVDASRRDVLLFSGLAKSAIVSILVGAAAYVLRDRIDPDLVLLRIAAVTLCMGTLYLAAVYAFRLPGWEDIQPERLREIARTAKRKLGLGNA